MAGLANDSYLERMKTLIVGCGYVGLSLGTELARRGHEVYGLRRTAEGAATMRAAGLHPQIGDITRSTDLDKLPNPFDWVVNTVSSSRGGVEDYRAVYLGGMGVLVAWLCRAMPQKFVYTSSTSVYGQEDGTMVTENSPTEPQSATSQVLLETERVALEAAREEHFPSVILRVAGIYGAGRGHLFKQYLNNEATLTDGGQRLSNMIHRDDLVGCLIAALERGRIGEVYNAVDDEPVTHRDFFQWLSNKLGRPMPQLTTAPATSQRKRALTNKRISNQKLKTELGYQFKYPTFREGYAAEIKRLRCEGQLC